MAKKVKKLKKKAFKRKKKKKKQVVRRRIVKKTRKAVRKKAKKPREISKPVLKLAKVEELPDAEKIKKTRTLVLGIGGGGGTIVSEIALKMPRASFVVANTDVQALNTVSRKASRFAFGQSLTHGLGTGMNAETGEQSALNERERIKNLLRGYDLCIMVSCLGGGTGSGSAPVFARIAKNLGVLTYGIFTLPFKFEGEKKMEIAKDSLKKVKGYLNILSVIPNERVFQIIDKSTPLRQALSVINSNLAEGLKSLIEIIYEPGLINIDFADFNTILEGRGKLAYLNTVDVKRGEGSTEEAIDKALNSPLYPYTIKGAKGVLLNIAGEKELSLSEVNEISKTIAEMVNPEAKIIFGVSQGKKYNNLIKTTLLVTGCGAKFFVESKEIEAVEEPKEVNKKTVKPRSVLKKEGKVKKAKRTKRTKRTKPRPKKAVKDKENKTKRRIKVIKVKKETAPTLEVPSTFREESTIFGKPQEAVRKSAIQVKRETERAEKEIAEKEKFWETPAFLRKRFFKGR